MVARVPAIRGRVPREDRRHASTGGRPGHRDRKVHRARCDDVVRRFTSASWRAGGPDGPLFLESRRASRCESPASGAAVSQSGPLSASRTKASIATSGERVLSLRNASTLRPVSSFHQGDELVAHRVLDRPSHADRRVAASLIDEPALTLGQRVAHDAGDHVRGQDRRMSTASQRTCICRCRSRLDATASSGLRPAILQR